MRYEGKENASGVAVVPFLPLLGGIPQILPGIMETAEQQACRAVGEPLICVGAGNSFRGERQRQRTGWHGHGRGLRS